MANETKQELKKEPTTPDKKNQKSDQEGKKGQNEGSGPQQGKQGPPQQGGFMGRGELCDLEKMVVNTF